MRKKEVHCVYVSTHKTSVKKNKMCDENKSVLICAESTGKPSPANTLE